MSAQTMSSAEERYSDALWTYENADHDPTPEELGALYAATSDYVSELLERLQERDDVYADALGVLSEAHEALTGQPSQRWEDLQNVGYYAEVQRDESQPLADGMERYHSDHHTGPASMCWQDACAYVNDAHGLAYVARSAS